MEGYQWGGGRRRMEEKVQGIRSINCRYKIGGEVKNSIGNGKAKEVRPKGAHTKAQHNYITQD